MNELFAVHMLNEEGKTKAMKLAEAFDALLAVVEQVVDLEPGARGAGGRELAIVRTELEAACFYAKKAMALQEENQSSDTGELGTVVAARAERMFIAYNLQGPNPGKTWDGKDVPTWDKVGPQVQAKWMAAAMVKT